MVHITGFLPQVYRNLIEVYINFLPEKFTRLFKKKTNLSI